MAHSLNNAAKQRFMKRTSEFSTRGSRRGFVDWGLPIPKDQLLSSIEKLDSVHEETRLLQLKIKEGREDLGIPRGKPVSQWIRNKELYGTKGWPEARKKQLSDLCKLTDRLQFLKKETETLKQKLGLAGMDSRSLKLVEPRHFRDAFNAAFVSLARSKMKPDEVEAIESAANQVAEAMLESRGYESE